MRIETVSITPEQAETWLAGSSGINQRALTNRRVLQFARAMVRGQWRVTHQGIAIDPDGVLIDGQHRLNAIVLAGIPVDMTVAFDVPRASFDVIDTGYARSPASILHIAGHGDANVLAAAVRGVMIYDVIGGTRKLPTGEVRGMFTSRDILDFMEGPRGDILRSTLSEGRAISINLSRIGMRTWMSSAIAILDESEPDLQLRSEFVDRVQSGAMLAEDSPILAFRRWVLSDTGYARTDKNYRAQMGIASFVKAWNYWIEGRTVGIMPIRPGRDEWPQITTTRAVLSGGRVIQDHELEGVPA